MALTCTGCTIPTTKNALVTPSDASACPALHGVYRSADCADNLDHWVHIGPAGDNYPKGFLRIISVFQPRDSHTALDSMSYVGFVEQIGQYQVLHIPLPGTLNVDSECTTWNRKWDAAQVGGYWVARLLVRPDAIEMADLNREFITDAIAAGKLTGQVAQERVKSGGIEYGKKTITMTAKSDELRDFFIHHIEGELFNTPDWVFTRAK